MYAHIKKLIKSCDSCLRYRAHKPKKEAESQKLPIATAPMEICHLDISGPYTQTFQGNKYIVAFVCAFSKWPDAWAVANIDSDTIADVLSEFIARYGCPRTLITDRGSQLISEGITKVYKLLGIQHLMSSPYRPQTNAKIERQHASISSALAHLVNISHTDWDKQLKFALLALRSATHVAINESPHFVFTGRDMVLPYNLLSQEPAFSYADCPSYCETLIPSLQTVFKEIKNNLEKAAESQEKFKNKKVVDKKIIVGDLTMWYCPAIKQGLSRKFAKLNTGPYRVIEKVGKVNYKIQLITDSSKVKIVHVNQLAKIENKPVFPALQCANEMEENLSQTEPKIVSHETVQNYPTRIFSGRNRQYLMETLPTQQEVHTAGTSNNLLTRNVENISCTDNEGIKNAFIAFTGGTVSKRAGIRVGQRTSRGKRKGIEKGVLSHRYSLRKRR